MRMIYRSPDRIVCAVLLIIVAFGCENDTTKTGDQVVDRKQTTAPAETPADATAASEPESVGEGSITDPEIEFVPIERLVITGAQVLSELREGPDGAWEPVGFDETTIVVEDGAVTRLVDARSYQLTPNDIVISARGRWVMAAPIVFGPPEDESGIADSLSGGAMVDLTLSGIGGVVVPAQVLETPAGRCAVARRKEREIPSAALLGVGADLYASIGERFPRVGISSESGRDLGGWIGRRIESGASSGAILAELTNLAAEEIGRSDLGRVEVGSRSDLLILDGDPLSAPMSILDPFAVTFGDRAIRRAEIEVLRDASMRGAQMRRQTEEMSLDSVDPDSIRRWLTSTQGQIFAGVAAGGDAGDIEFMSRVGQPRFDQSSGRIRLDPESGTPNFELAYEGPPESFSITSTPIDIGLSIDLRIAGGEPITRDAPGPTTPPVIDLPLDLDVRRDRIGIDGKTVFDLQELLYGSGPIGLSPRRYELTPLERVDCPPCFEGCDPVYRIEVFDPERGGDIVAAVMTVGFRDGRPSRGRYETATGPIWFDELSGPGRAALD